ncbi:hypothetical protein ACEY16_11035 [Lactiplantibacillus plantarum]
MRSVDDDVLSDKLIHAQDDRLFYLTEAIRRGYPIDELAELTKINVFFLDKLLHIIEIEQALRTHTDDIETLTVLNAMASPIKR